MFIEPNRSFIRRGWTEVICGSMFSGKTEELIRRLKRARIAHQQTAIFKPAIDVRYDAVDIVSHDASRFVSVPVKNAAEILPLAADVDVVGIDEAQFFDPEIEQVTAALALKGIRVIIAGLDMDFKGRSFGSMPNLLAQAEFITKLHAICAVCGDAANFSYRTANVEREILLGDGEMYEARCRHCFHNGTSGSDA